MNTFENAIVIIFFGIFVMLLLVGMVFARCLSWFCGFGWYFEDNRYEKNNEMANI